jgi:RNA polymerase sigma-70 factor (ECF subfamily)
VSWRLAAALDSEFSNDRRRAQEALAGDEGATALFEAHRREVYRVARAVTGDHEAARDAVQDTFLRVFRGLPRWRGESSLRTWIVRIAVRTAVDQRRRSSRHALATNSRREPSHDPRAQIDHALALRRVQELAGGLDGQQGLILRLRLLGGLDNREVAEALGLREPNVRMQLTKAIRRLREKL